MWRHRQRPKVIDENRSFSHTSRDKFSVDGKQDEAFISMLGLMAFVTRTDATSVHGD